MLDGENSYTTLDPKGISVWWGAYLGMAQQVLRSGALTDTGAEIARTRAALKSQHGWIMDTYLLRKRTP